MTLLSVVCPAYNVEKGLAEIAYRVFSMEPDLKKVGVDQLELLILDDGSKDRTAKVASNIAGVRLICHPRNKGYGRHVRLVFLKQAASLLAFWMQMERIYRNIFRIFAAPR